MLTVSPPLLPYVCCTNHDQPRCCPPDDEVAIELQALSILPRSNCFYSCFAVVAPSHRDESSLPLLS
ncbi:hypothetical protein NL676_021603 [Syzygium grande]|nr:hypothetical protein NL676_021603 [Syzygium grande]